MGNLAQNPNNQLSAGPVPQQFPNLNSLGMNQGQGATEVGPYGTPVTFDADRRGFTNANGGHDWVAGQGPGGNWNGEDQPTGLAPIGQDPGSGDALGYERNTAAYAQATAKHKAWIQQNRAAGRTLADLGMQPVRGGGLSNYMEMAGTPRGTATDTTPVPGTPNAGPGRVGLTSLGGGGGTIPGISQPLTAQVRQGAGAVNPLNTASRPRAISAPPPQTTVPGQMNYGAANTGMSSLGLNQAKPKPISGSLGFNQTRLNTNRVY